MEKVDKFSSIMKAESNPYMGDLGYQMLVKKKGYIGGTLDRLLLDPVSGESSPLRVVGSYREVDQETFVKVYKKHVKALFNMTRTGNTVFSYIVEHLEQDKGEIYIYIKDLMEYADWDQVTMCYRGLTELYNAGIIWPSIRAGWYYINPGVIFNGNRIAYVEEYRMVETPVEVKGDDPMPEMKSSFREPKTEVNGDYERVQ